MRSRPHEGKENLAAAILECQPPRMMVAVRVRGLESFWLKLHATPVAAETVVWADGENENGSSLSPLAYIIEKGLKRVNPRERYGGKGYVRGQKTGKSKMPQVAAEEPCQIFTVPAEELCGR